jgi:hypothetical protein
VLLLELIARVDDSLRVYGIAVVGLSLGYGVLGLVVQRRGVRDLLRPLRDDLRPFALPIFIVGQALCLAGLIWTLAPAAPGLALIGYSLGVVQYACAAAISRRGAFSAPLAIALAVAYMSALCISPLPVADYGPALLPGLVAFLAIGEVFRRTADAAEVIAEHRGRAGATTWALPFDAIMHLGAAAAFLLCLAGTHQLLAWWGIAALYAARAALRRRPEPLYAAVGVGVAAYLGTGVVLAPDADLSIRLLSLSLPVWCLFWLAHGISRRQPVDVACAPAPLRWGGPAGTDSWARPLLIWGAITLVISSVLSGCDALLRNAAADLGTALAALLLLAIFSLLWRSRTLAWAGTALAALAYQEALSLAGVPWSDQPVCWAAGALAAGMLAAMLGRRSSAGAHLWVTPLLWASYTAGALALLVAVGGLASGRSALQPLAATMTVIGAALVLEGIAGRERRLCYLGIALLNGAACCTLAYHQVAEAQAYAVPPALSLLLLAYLEWRRGAARTKTLLESVGIAVLLGTTLVQGCGGLGVDGGRYSYATALLLESVAVFGLGAALRWKRTFFAACAAMVAAVCLLLADPMRSMNTWYLMAIIGGAMIGIVVFLEQRRQQIPLWIDEVRLRLETWD